MKYYQKLVLFPMLLFLNLLFFPVAAQNNIAFSSLSSSDGLSSGAIISIFQDSKGYMWFGTYDGLNLYNGHEITIYSHDENDSTSISNSYINDIDEDKYGNIWVATNNGLNVYNRNTRTFNKIDFDRSERENITDAINYILNILIDIDIIWVGTHAGLYKLNVDDLLNNKNADYLNHYFVLREGASTRSHSSIEFLYKNKKGSLWVKGYTSDIYEYNVPGDTFVDLRVMPEILPRFNNINVDNREVLWISTFPENLYFHYEGKLSSESPYPGLNGLFDGVKFNHVLDVSDSVMWLATDGNGLYIYNRNMGTINRKRTNLSDPGSLSSDKLCYLYKDKQDVVWVGTVNNGVNVYNPKKSRFNHVYPVPGKKNCLKSKNIISVAEGQDGKFWIGTEVNGIILFDPVTNTFKYNKEIDEDLDCFEQITIKELFIDSEGILWISAYLKGLYAYHPKLGVLQQFLTENQNDGTNAFSESWCITEDKNGGIWIGTLHDGVFHYYRKERRFIHYSSDPDNKYSVAHHGILDIHVDGHNVLWIGTYDGLSMTGLDSMDYTNAPDDIKYKSFRHTRNENSISSNRILSISEGANGEILIGTETGGLNIYDPLKGIFTCINRDNGLPSNKITGASMDSKSRIWVTSNMGLSFIEPDLEKVHNYNVADGLQSNECKFLFKTTHGNYFIGGNNGFNHFNPGDIQVDTGEIDLYLTSIKIFGQEVLPGIPFNGRVLFTDYKDEAEIPVFRYDENSISFEFLAVDFLNPSKVEYACLLEGFDDTWKYHVNGRVSTYTNLPYGDYIFKIRSTNSDGIWNDKVFAFPFTISPPFWKTQLAYFIYLALVITLIFTGRYLAIKEIKIRNDLKLEQLKRENENEVNQLKLAFFTNISHELRTPLTLIAGPVNSLFNKAREREWGEDILQQFRLVSRNVSRLSELTDQLLDLRKLETGKMRIELQHVTLATFIEEISTNFKSLITEKNITYVYRSNIPEQLEVDIDTDKLYKILSNLLSNAVKYAPENGRVYFNVDYDKELLSFEIKDSGIGIKREHLPHIFDRFYQVKSQEGRKNPGTGIGLALTRDLVNLLGGRVTVESIQGIGTSFFVYLPLQKSSHTQDSPSCYKLPLFPFNRSDVSKEYAEIAGTGKKDTILVVEDNPDMRKYIQGLLNSYFSVIEAVDGRTGLETAMEKIPDLIISDIMMPDMDGIEMGKTLKSDSRTSHIPLILLTALASTDDKVEGLKTGADDYLTKPFNEEILLLKVRNHLKLRENIQQYFLKQAGLKEPDETGTINLANATKINKIDRDFIEKIKKIVADNIEDADFNVKMLAREAGMGNTQLFLKMKALLNTSPGNFITGLRLIKAKQLLQEGELNVNEVAYRVGFTDPKYFSKCFKKYFGQIPSKYLG